MAEVTFKEKVMFNVCCFWELAMQVDTELIKVKFMKVTPIIMDNQ